MGFRVWGLGFRSLGFQAAGLGFGIVGHKDIRRPWGACWMVPLDGGENPGILGGTKTIQAVDSALKIATPVAHLVLHSCPTFLQEVKRKPTV